MKIASALFPTSHYAGAVTVNSPKELTGCDLLVLHGGSDISTSLYGAAKGMSTSSEFVTRRDAEEVALAKVAIRKGIPILGICRGAQLLCVIDGGSLWQHVQNHMYGFHDITYKGNEYLVNTCHHQMMRPTKDALILAVSKNLSPVKYANGSTQPIEHLEDEPEIVYFPNIKAVGVQGHPEWLRKDDDLNMITNEIVKDHLNVELTCRC